MIWCRRAAATNTSRRADIREVAELNKLKCVKHGCAVVSRAHSQKWSLAATRRTVWVSEPCVHFLSVWPRFSAACLRHMCVNVIRWENLCFQCLRERENDREREREIRVLVTGGYWGRRTTCSTTLLRNVCNEQTFLLSGKKCGIICFILHFSDTKWKTKVTGQIANVSLRWNGCCAL